MQLNQKYSHSLRLFTAMLSILCILLAAAVPAVRVFADEAITVEGTVTDKTTDGMLYLSTSGGLMIIKIDSSTDLSGCKMLLPDKKVRVTCARQSDEYLHASRITAVVQPSSTPSSSITGAVTVQGKVLSGTTDTLLKLDTSGGQMVLKVDGNTNWDGCRFLTVGKSVYVTTARGSDAYMHALVISDSAPASSNGSGSSSSADIQSQISGNSVKGIVTKDTTPELLQLNTSGGLMKIKVDASTDLSGCRALVTGREVAVGWVRGDDAYLHATKIVGVRKADNTASVDSSSAVTVQGKVTGETTENILYLNTSGGRMAIKLDPSTVMNCRVLTENASVSVSVARGSDAYMHAISVSSTSQASNNSSGSSASTDIASQISGSSVKGTVAKDTTPELLQLNTSGGLMKIKVDSSTDLSGCRALVTGREVAVGWVRGNDAYLHATKIVGVRKSESAASVDTASAVTVQGKVTAETTENILYLETSGGKMAIKLDPSTVMNCRVLTENASVSVSAARGSDAYMHAVKIDSAGSSQSSSSSSQAASQTVTPTGDTIIVQGTVKSDTTENTLSLKTSGGDMLIRLDANTNLSLCKALITGDTVAVTCYRGSDAYFHASAIVGTVQPGSVTVSSDGAVAVTGTVATGTNGGLLCLDSSGGSMQIKLDAGTKMGSCRVLTLGRSVKVIVVRGSDAYMHAISIDAN